MPSTTPQYALPYLNASDSPDLSGGLYALAKYIDDHYVPIDRTCDAYWGDANNEAQQVNGPGWTYVPTSTVQMDPFGMRQGDGLTYKLPWQGRYSVWLRAEFTADDTAARYMLGIYNQSNGTDLALKAIAPVRANTPVDLHAEIVAPAGTLIRPRAYRDSTGSQYLRRYVGNQESQRIVLRYLGAA